MDVLQEQSILYMYNKRREMDLSRTVLSSMPKTNTESLVKQLHATAELMFPEIKEDRDKFIKKGSKILDEEIGKEYRVTAPPIEPQRNIAQISYKTARRLKHRR